MKEFIVKYLDTKYEEENWYIQVEWNDGSLEWLSEEQYDEAEKDIRGEAYDP